MKDENILLALIAVFVPYSLVSIGGAPSVFAGMQHQAVDVHHWLTARQFVDMFAISRAAPGPGSLLSTLIGWQVGGWTGAVIATLAFYVPSSLLCYGTAYVWRRHRGKRWHTALEQGLAPVGIGLILAGIIALFRVSGGGALSWLIAFGSAGLMTWKPKLHPLLIFATGGAIFVALHAMNWDHLV